MKSGKQGEETRFGIGRRGFGGGHVRRLSGNQNGTGDRAVDRLARLVIVGRRRVGAVPGHGFVRRSHCRVRNGGAAERRQSDGQKDDQSEESPKIHVAHIETIGQVRQRNQK